MNEGGRLTTENRFHSVLHNCKRTSKSSQDIRKLSCMAGRGWNICTTVWKAVEAVAYEGKTQAGARIHTVPFGDRCQTYAGK